MLAKEAFKGTVMRILSRQDVSSRLPVMSRRSSNFIPADPTRRVPSPARLGRVVGASAQKRNYMDLVGGGNKSPGRVRLKLQEKVNMPVRLGRFEMPKRLTKEESTATVKPMPRIHCRTV